MDSGLRKFRILSNRVVVICRLLCRSSMCNYPVKTNFSSSRCRPCCDVRRRDALFTVFKTDGNWGELGIILENSQPPHDVPSADRIIFGGRAILTNFPCYVSMCRRFGLSTLISTSPTWTEKINKFRWWGSPCLVLVTAAWLLFRMPVRKQGGKILFYIFDWCVQKCSMSCKTSVAFVNISASTCFASWRGSVTDVIIWSRCLRSFTGVHFRFYPQWGYWQHKKNIHYRVKTR